MSLANQQTDAEDAELLRAVARGDEAANRIGTCQSCHSGAAKSDYICSAGSGCPPVPLSEEQIAQIQKNDPRCQK